jgi:hypothetical protein
MVNTLGNDTIHSRSTFAHEKGSWSTRGALHYIGGPLDFEHMPVPDARTSDRDTTLTTTAWSMITFWTLPTCMSLTVRLQSLLTVVELVIVEAADPGTILLSTAMAKSFSP